MTSDEFESLEEGQYFTPIAFREEAECEAEKPRTSKPLSKREQLDEVHRIAADVNESYSVRMDARRLIEVAALRPWDFEEEFRDFKAWRAETTK